MKDLKTPRNLTSTTLIHEDGEDILFDHARYHELIKTDEGRRVVLILDVHRCF